MITRFPNTSITALRGFTIVELVVVIIILVILSVVAITRLSLTDGFAEYTFQRQFMSALREMQIKAMQDTRADSCFQININTVARTINPSTNITNGSDCSSPDVNPPEHLVIETSRLAEEYIRLQASTSLTFIGFNNQGLPLIDTGVAASQIKIDFIGENTASTCIEAQGYVHEC